MALVGISNEVVALKAGELGLSSSSSLLSQSLLLTSLMRMAFAFSNDARSRIRLLFRASHAAAPDGDGVRGSLITMPLFLSEAAPCCRRGGEEAMEISR